MSAERRDFRWRRFPPLHSQRQVGNERVNLLCRDLPAALSVALQQEDIVRVDVRAHASARRRVAHHHVVDSGMRDEIEVREQTIGAPREMVGVLHQDGPVAAWKLLEARGGKWPVLESP